MKTVTNCSVRLSLFITLLSTLITGFMTTEGAVQAASPLLPDVTVTASCRIHGPEGPPVVRLKIINIGNDRAENRLGVTSHVTLGGTNATTILYPALVISLQPGHSLSTLMTLPTQSLSASAKMPEIRLSLTYVAKGTTKPMEEHSVSNNRFLFDSYLGLPSC